MRITSKKGSGFYLQLGIKHRNVPTISSANYKRRVPFFFSFKEKQKGRALKIPFNAREKKNQREKDIVKLSQVNFKE